LRKVARAVGKADQADTAEVLRLQGVLRQRHEELAKLDGDGAGRVSQLNKVFAAANELVNFEARRPLLRDERRRKVSSLVVYVAAGAAAAVMLAEVALMLFDRVSWWYLSPVIPVAAAAGIIGASERGAPTPGHRGRAGAAVTVALAAALVAVVTAHVLPVFSLLLLLPALIGAGFGWLTGTGDAEGAQ
jgi:hypothetical protein